MNIVIATDDRYFCAAETLINSLRRLHNSEEILTVYVLKSKSSHVFLDSTISNSPFFRVRLIEVPENCDIYRMYTSVHITNMSYIKLFLDRLLPETIGRVLYLDCDVALTCFPSELFSLEMDGAPIAAVQDFLLTERTGILLGDNTDESIKYFNAGVLLIDLPKVRQMDYLESARHLAIMKKYDLHDQDALNEVFARKWLMLPMKWNFQIGYFDPRTTHPDVIRQMELCLGLDAVKLVHYTGKYKPWSADDPSILASVYRRWHFGSVGAICTLLYRDLRLVVSLRRRLPIKIKLQLRLLTGLFAISPKASVSDEAVALLNANSVGI